MRSFIPQWAQGLIVIFAVILAWSCFNSWYVDSRLGDGLIAYPPGVELRLVVMGVLLTVASFGPFLWLYDWACEVLHLTTPASTEA